MTITRNVEKTSRVVEEMAEAQIGAYEAAADNLAAFQRRGTELAQNGTRFLELQERNARAAQEWWASGLKVLRLQQRNAEFARGWLTVVAEALRDQAQDNARTAEAFARSARAQREGFNTLARAWAGFYRDSYFSPLTYAREATEQGLRLAAETSAQAGQAVEQTAQAARHAQLWAAILSALGTNDYDALTVAELSERLGRLSNEELKEVRGYEKRNKDRETLVGQIDRKLRTTS